eukprot:UN03558
MVQLNCDHILPISMGGDYPTKLQALQTFDNKVQHCWQNVQQVQVYQLDLTKPTSQHKFIYQQQSNNLYLIETSANKFMLYVATGFTFLPKVITSQCMFELNPEQNTLYYHDPTESLIWAFYTTNVAALKSLYRCCQQVSTHLYDRTSLDELRSFVLVP